MCASYTNLGTKIMQKGFILRDGCSETDFQSTHHCCSTHEAVRSNNITYMRSSEICMHMCIHKNPHWIKSPCVHACLKILHEVLIITTPISIHCFKDLWHCWIKKQFSTSKYNSWKPVFRWGACYGCMGWSLTCYTYTDQTNPVHLGHSDRVGITVKRQFAFGHFWLFWQRREADIYQPTKLKAKPLFPCTRVIRARCLACTQFKHNRTAT